MKTISVTVKTSGKRRVVVELDMDEALAVVRKDSHYRLGGQVEDVVASDVLTEMRRVFWCSIAQRWEDA